MFCAATFNRALWFRSEKVSHETHDDGHLRRRDDVHVEQGDLSFPAQFLDVEGE